MTRFPLSIRSRFRLLTRSRCVALVGPENTVFDTVSWPSSLLFVLGLKKARSRVLYAAPRSEQAAGYFKRHREVSKQPYTLSHLLLYGTVRSASKQPATLNGTEKQASNRLLYAAKGSKQAEGYSTLLGFNSMCS